MDGRTNSVLPPHRTDPGASDLGMVLVAHRIGIVSPCPVSHRDSPQLRHSPARCLSSARSSPPPNLYLLLFETPTPIYQSIFVHPFFFSFLTSTIADEDIDPKTLSFFLNHSKTKVRALKYTTRCCETNANYGALFLLRFYRDFTGCLTLEMKLMSTHPLPRSRSQLKHRRESSVLKMPSRSASCTLMAPNLISPYLAHFSKS